MTFSGLRRTQVLLQGRDRAVLAILAVFFCFDAALALRWAGSDSLHAATAQWGWLSVATVFPPGSRANAGVQIEQARVAFAAVDIAVLQPISLALAIALIRHHPSRVPLMIAVGGYGVYAVLVRWLVLALADLHSGPEEFVSEVLLCVATSLPRLAAYFFVAVEGWRQAWSILAASGRREWRRRDLATAILIVFYILVGCTAELFFVLHAFDIRSQQNLLSRIFEIYAAGDDAYFAHPTWFEIGLEAFQVFISVPLNVVLLWAILARWRLRWPLQVTLGSYIGLSVCVYFASKHLSGYAATPTHDALSFFILVAPNLPWLLGNLALAWSASRELAFGTGQAGT